MDNSRDQNATQQQQFAAEQPPAWAQTFLSTMAQATEQQNARIAQLEEKLVAALTMPATTTTTQHQHDSVPTEASTPVNVATFENTQLPRSRLPDPPKFDGDRFEWPAWKVTMENKLYIDSPALGNPTAQFLYIYSRLEGNALKNVTTYVKQNRENGNPSAFLEYLHTLYGDANAASRAANRLHKLRQGDKQPFAKFLPMLEKELADAGALEWPDEAKKPILISALNQQMSTALVNRGIPGTFMDIIRRLHEISADMDIISLQNNNRPFKQPIRSFSKATHNEPIYEPMDWTSSTNVHAFNSRGPPNPDGFASMRPEDQNLIGKRAKWVTPEVLAKRKEENRCLRCGRDHCRIITCPLKMAKRPEGPTPHARSHHTTARRALITEAQFEEDEDEGIFGKSEEEQLKA